MHTHTRAFSLSVAAFFALVAFLIPVSYAAADSLTVAPTTALNGLIGATNTQWVFTATTTSAIGRGNVVQFVLPSVVQAQPFSVGTLTLVATSSIDLYTATTSSTEGVSVANTPGGPVIYGFATSTVPAGTTFSVTLGGINNAIGQLSSMSNLAWNARAGTSTDPMQPGGDLSQAAFIATSTQSLVRFGGALVSDANSKITATSYDPGATNVSYTFSIKTASNIVSGGKIGINFPAEFSLQNATTTATQTIDAGVTVAAGAIATSTSPGTNRVILTTSGSVAGGDVITVTVNGLTNPATAGVYRPFSIFTMRANNGLIDGSYFGFEQTDYSNGAPPPSDTVYIGGKNTLVVQVLKSNGSGGTTALTASDIAQVKVGVGCPDKGYFMGTQWLNASGVATYNNILDCNYMTGVDPFNQGSSTFYSTFLPPGMQMVNLVSSGGVGQTSTTTLVFGVPNATTTIALTGGVSGKTAFINAYSADNQSFANVYTTTGYSTLGFDPSGNGYARIPINSGEEWNFNVMGGAFGSSANFTDSSGNKYWAPVIPSINLTSGTTTPVNLGTFAYVLASDTLNVSLVDTSGGAITNACVGVSRSGGGIFMGQQDTICAPNYPGNVYQFKVPPGSITINVNRNGFGAPAQYPVAISSATTNKTITLSAPTSFIKVLVQTSGGTPIKGAPVMANGSNGFGNAMTDTNGAAKIYVPSGTYSVQGFAPAFGQLTAQTVATGNATTTFTVNTGTLKTISGTVTQGGVGVVGINVGAHGTGSTTGGNGTQTDASGNYTLYVPAGTYQVQTWSQNTGGATPQNVDVSSADAPGISWALGAQGTLHITISNASTISPLFAGAFDASTGKGNGTNTWTTSGTSEVADITLPAGTYNVQAGSPSLGQFGSQTGVVISGGGTTNVTFDAQASSTLVTLSGATSVANVNVWASRVNGQGFFSTQTDSSGNYSLQVPRSATYHMGVRSLAYIATQGDIDVSVSTSNVTQNFTLTAAGATITGRVLDSNGNGIANGWVMALKTGVASSTQIGAPTDAGGNYTLNVDPSSTWSLTAQGPCFLPASAITATANDTGKNITLAAQSGCSAPTPDVSAITDSSGGQISKSDMTLNIPASALGTSQNSVNVSVTNAASVVSSANATPLAGSVKDITATNSSGQSITSLNNDASLSITYDPSQLPVGFDASKLQLGYFDNTTGQWEPVAATVDTTNHTLTAQVSHFTEYGPILPGVPSAPTGLSASAASTSGINLSWTASPTATGYTIYRSSTNSGFTTSIATGVTSASYADTGLSAGTQYYYEVAGVNSNGEGSNSSSANATTNAAAVASSGGSNGSISIPTTSSTVVNTIASTTTNTATTQTTTTPSQTESSIHASLPSFTRPLYIRSTGKDVMRLQALLGVEQTGYFGVLTRAAVEAFQVKYGIAGRGDAGYGIFGPKTRAKIGDVFGETSANTTAQSPSTTVQIPTGFSFTRGLTIGLTGEEVKMLQIVLNSDPDTRVAQNGYGSPGNETVNFGPATKAAVGKFQLKYGIVASARDSALGLVGPKTRAKLNELLTTSR
ncbi:MAG: beta strand repeat-containing protein [Minisyncoccota bacterium]